MIATRSILCAVLIGCGEPNGTAAARPPAGPTFTAVSKATVTPRIDGPDAKRPRVAVRWRPVAEGFSQVTDVQFPPPRPDDPGAVVPMVVLEKEGRARVAGHGSEPAYTLLSRDVITRSEMGLLGLAFHPDFWSNGKLYINHSVRRSTDRQALTRISELRVDPAAPKWAATDERIILEVDQPYANHDAGQLAFGPDGMLYIGLGDGGSGGDPLGHGQSSSTLLGSMLRIDVDQQPAGRPYAIPTDNPLIGQAGARPEIYAFGLRNPWRYSFDPSGRLIVGDVGQDLFEEIDIVTAGANLGWNTREARHCYPPDVTVCPPILVVDPVYEYDRDDGSSITGGYVYTGGELPALAHKYVFADFASGRVWAIELPAKTPVTGLGAPMPTATALGRADWMPATFGRDNQGELYLADFGSGVIYVMEAG